MGRKMLIKEASLELGLTKNALRNAIRAGKIPFFTVGNRYVVDIDLVERTLEQTALSNMEARQSNSFPHNLRRVRV